MAPPFIRYFHDITDIASFGKQLAVQVHVFVYRFVIVPHMTHNVSDMFFYIIKFFLYNLTLFSILSTNYQLFVIDFLCLSND